MYFTCVCGHQLSTSPYRFDNTNLSLVLQTQFLIILGFDDQDFLSAAVSGGDENSDYFLGLVQRINERNSK